jgi:hypothetical protein
MRTDQIHSTAGVHFERWAWQEGQQDDRRGSTMLNGVHPGAFAVTQLCSQMGADTFVTRYV